MLRDPLFWHNVSSSLVYNLLIKSHLALPLPLLPSFSIDNEINEIYSVEKVVSMTISTSLLCSSIFLINLYFSCNRCLCWIRKRRKLLLKQVIQREQEEIVGRWKRLCLNYLNDSLIGVYETSYKKLTNLKYVL